MTSLKGFWQFLNTDVKDIPWGELAEKGIEAVSASNDLGEMWEEHKSDLSQLAPYFEKVEPVLEVLGEPNAQLLISGLPFVSTGIGLLKLYLGLNQTKPTLDSSLIVVSQLAYLHSLEAVLETWEPSVTEALSAVTFGSILEKQLTRLDTETLDSRELEKVTSCFRESNLAKQFHTVLLQELQQAGIDATQAKRFTEHVTWGTYHYLHRAIIEAGEIVESLAEYYRMGGAPKYISQGEIHNYLRNVIEPLPKEQIFDENNPLITFRDVYVPLKVQSLTQSGEKEETRESVNSHFWAQKILETPGPKKVMFIQGNAGQGKSVFCRMFAEWVQQNNTFPYIPLFVCLRNLRTVNDNLTETLETCPDLQSVEFVGKEGWLKDKNIRFLIILDGFDELLLQGRASGGLQEFLQQVSDFQKTSHHQCLVTGRPLALQGVEQRITQDKNLERVRLEPMDDDLREQWLSNWQLTFGEEEIRRFRDFLGACPTQVANNLAREPLLLYLLARIHRENKLNSDMFADAKKESQAKLQIYRESVNWVLEKQRQAENLRLSGLDDPDDLREVLQETALCVVQSGNETAQLSMLKARFRDSTNPVADSLRTAQEIIGQSEDKTLNNLLTTFYLRPGEVDKRGSVEFAHKSFGEYLFAELLIAAFEKWTELDRRKRFRLDNRSVHRQIYDLLGFGGLSVSIVEYVSALLEESNIDLSNLFQRLHIFYEHWCNGEFLDQIPNENLPQKKFLQLKNQAINLSLKQVDIFAGLNTLIILFGLHSGAQPDKYPNLSTDEPKSESWFSPCGKPGTEQFDDEKLLKIIHYVDSLGIGIFTKIVGPHLSRANLSSARLCRANLSGANLSSADLSNANLSRANLSRANLSRADLYAANLYGANLSRADLSSVILSSAMLSKVNLSNANLSSANLSSAVLSSAVLSSAKLLNVNLSNANLYRANLSRANLSRARFSNANLYSANFYRANLSRANLYSADLYRADLSRANLSSAILSSAILIGTRLSTAQNLTSQQLEGKMASLICNATLPTELEAYCDRDRDHLPAVLRERYPEQFESLETAEKFINEQ